MKINFIIASLFCIIFSCKSDSNLKNELLEFEVCILKCEDLENNNNFNFFKCSQECVDLFDRKKAVCLDMNREDHLKCLEAITPPRDECLAYCQQQAMNARKDSRDQIKKCKEMCIYQFKKKGGKGD